MRTAENTMTIQLDDPDDPGTIRSREIASRYGPMLEEINRAGRFSPDYRRRLEEFFPNGIDDSVNIIAPFHIDYPTEIRFGRRIFINQGLTCVARGGIVIEDDVMIGPNVSLLTVNHDLKDHWRLYASPIVLKRNCWIGAGASIIPGVVVGENAVVAAAAVVTKDVPPDTVVAGNPAKVIKRIERGDTMSRMLVVYYSWSNGNTERIAKELAEAKGADLARIETVEPYKGSYQDVVDQGQDEVERGYEPPIKPLSKNVADYDVVAVGTPTWWYTMAPAVKTFFSTTDLKGKTVVPFMTNGGWPGHVIKDMTKAAKGANVVHPMEVQFDSNGGDHQETPQKDVDGWIASVRSCNRGGRPRREASLLLSFFIETTCLMAMTGW